MEFISIQARGGYLYLGEGITGCTLWFTGRWAYNWEGRGWGLISGSLRKKCATKITRVKIYHVLNEFHADQTYQLLAEFRRSPAPVDKS